jgi:hypothetical protein
VQLVNAGHYVMPNEDEVTVKRNCSRDALAKTQTLPLHHFANFSPPQHYLSSPNTSSTKKQKQ